MTDLKNFQKTLGHTFKNQALLEEALTHPSSAVHEKTADYERLEFLGDRVLGLLVAQWLFEKFKKEPEGTLARRHSNLVCRTALVQVAKEIQLDKHIRLAKGERKSGGQEKASVLADGCEAVIAALYLDGGLGKAEKFVKQYWQPLIEESDNAEKDHKSALQEWAQGRGLPAPSYDVVEKIGPEHAPIFTIKVTVKGYDPVEAKGTSKQEAAQKAAGDLLEKLR